MVERHYARIALFDHFSARFEERILDLLCICFGLSVTQIRLNYNLAFGASLECRDKLGSLVRSECPRL